MLNTKLPKRNAEDYQNLSKWQVQNHLRTETTKQKQRTPGNTLHNFMTSALWSWLRHYLKSRFGWNHSYPAYGADDNGVYRVQSSSENPEISIGIVSDWATDTQESYLVAQKMSEHRPNFTIHVGDTYYVGAPMEIQSNFLDQGSPWCRGSSGSFAVLGNHEMFARGVAFFDHLLPSLGMKNNSGKYTGQKAGYFCLENDHWRILGLDTGYHSIGKVPLFELLPWFAPDCHFDDTLMNWLENEVKLGDASDKRGIVILTHHQYFSAFNQESDYIKPAEQLAKIIGKDRPVLWLCGHEHKLAVYEKCGSKDGVQAYLRCIGHGGMPVNLDSSSFKLKAGKIGSGKLVFADQRVYENLDGHRMGFNGYVVVKLLKERLTLEYYDINNFLFSESWIAKNNGEIKGFVFNKPNELNPEPNKAWADAIR